jgi:hypothetical protein
MKRMFRIFLMSAAAAILAATLFAQDQSLGDAARSARMSKPASAPGARVYTNDNLPTGTGLGIAALSSAPTSAAEASTTASSPKADAEGAAEKPKATTPGESAEERQKVIDDWKGKIDDQKKEISQLERELNVLQREGQISQAVYYADAGTQLRDPKRYADEQRTRQADLDSKQKALDDAKQKLSDLENQARQAGVPAGQLD